MKPIIHLLINRTVRSRILIESDGKVLLVKGWLSQRRWSLPGGGIKKFESYELGAKREIKEETGLDVDKSSLKFLGKFMHVGDGGYYSFEVVYFYAQVKNALAIKSPSPWEIVDVRWFRLNELPTQIGPITKQAIQLSRKADLI